MINKTTKEYKSIIYLVIFVLSLLITILSRDNFFFWDTISQVSIPANWFYDNDFKYLFVPDDLATGHPPTAGLYLALLWKIFGRSLSVSHFAVFPFIFGIFIQLYKLIKRSGERGIIIWLIMGVTIIDPTLFSQLSLVSFDIIQLFFFLWCINCIIEHRQFSLATAFLGLCLISLRGMISGAGVILFSLIYDYNAENKIYVKRLAAYLPGIIVSLTFFILFFLEKHWIIHNTVSEKWAQSSQFASIDGIVRNIGILGWRLVDFGRLGLWFVFLLILISILRNYKLTDSFAKTILLISITQFISIFPFCILYNNPFGHRYLLSVIISVSIFTAYWILKYYKRKWLTFSFVAALVAGGWFWVYPDKIATGWDATPAHWPYYEIRKKMINYINEEKISISEIGSFFPNKASLKFVDLSKIDIAFKEAEIDSDKYILYSNVFNLDDKTINALFYSKNWLVIKSISKRCVKMILFKRI